MGIEFSFADVVEFLDQYGLTLPSWVVGIVLFLIVAQFLGLFTLLSKLPAVVRGVWRFFGRFRYDPDTKRFITVRNRFAEHLISEIKRLNREADWNDFYYTQLEATVEVDQSVDYGEHGVVVTILKFLFAPVRRLFGVGYGRVVKDSLVEAIESSSARTFLVIGDPGSGKTVSLRHLFLRLAQKAAKSKNKQTVVPIYLNLKSLDIPPEEVTADHVRQWILAQIEQGQDRLIYGFLENHFETMLDAGQFFFLFDSFDEIPAVMDAHEDADIVRAYALALHRFLTAPHGCSGLVSSRPYRAPKIFIGQRLTIRPLNDKRIRNALDKYLSNDNALFRQIWEELTTQKRDLLKVARNPFYLSLIARYTAENQLLPTRHYDLFDHFVQSRVVTDEQRLAAYGLTPVETVELTSQLAYQMLQTDRIGLEATEDELREMLQSDGWQADTITQLLGALNYSKLGTFSTAGTLGATTFSFVHRRFHEYFCALYLRQRSDQIPIADLMLDNRWREVLVLLCEILPIVQLNPVFAIAGGVLTNATNDPVNYQQKRDAFETLRFLRDGFKGRLFDIPNSLRKTCTDFIRAQFQDKNALLNQKRAIESLSLAQPHETGTLLSLTLESSSVWIKDAGINACDVLISITDDVKGLIKKRLEKIYMNHNWYSLPKVFDSLKTATNPDLIELGYFQHRLRIAHILSFPIGLLMTLLVVVFWTVVFINASLSLGSVLFAILLTFTFKNIVKMFRSPFIAIASMTSVSFINILEGLKVVLIALNFSIPFILVLYALIILVESMPFITIETFGAIVLIVFLLFAVYRKGVRRTAESIKRTVVSIYHD